MMTLQQIRDQSPCLEGWTKLLKSLGNPPMDTVISLGDVAKSNGAADAWWCVRALDWSDMTLRRQVIAALMPSVERAAKHTTDKRVHDCIGALKDWIDGKPADFDGAAMAAEAASAEAAAAWAAKAAEAAMAAATKAAEAASAEAASAEAAAAWAAKAAASAEAAEAWAAKAAEAAMAAKAWAAKAAETAMAAKAWAAKAAETAMAAKAAEAVEMKAQRADLIAAFPPLILHNDP